MTSPRPLLFALAFTLALAGLIGCSGGDPVRVVRDFHIAAIQEDQDALDRTMITSGPTTPATDFRNLRDVFVYFAKSHPITDDKYTGEFVDEVCRFALDQDASGDGEMVVQCSADLSRILVPFLGDAARGVVGKPKDIVKYTMRLGKEGTHWKVKSMELPFETLNGIGQRFGMDVTEIPVAPDESKD